MSLEAITTLICNVALLLALGQLYNFVFRTMALQRWWAELVTGAAIGCVGITLMAMPWEFTLGLFFDTRSILLSVAALFFGAVPGLVAMTTTVLFRLYQGGDGVWMGVGVIVTSTALGLVWRAYIARRQPKTDAPRWVELYLFGVVVHVAMLLWILALPAGLGRAAWRAVSAPVLIIYPIGTVALGTYLGRSREQRRIEQDLAASEERFRKAVEQAPFPIIILADDGEILTISQAWTAITGYTHAEIPTIDAWTERAYGARRQEVQAIIGTLFSLTGPVDEGEFTVTCKDGSRRVWVFSSAPLGRLSDGRRIVMSMAADVTERKQMETALRESEEQFALFMQHLPGYVFIKDQAGRYLFVNNRFSRIGGGDLKSLLGKTDFDFWLRAYAERIRESDVRLLASRTSQFYEEENEEDGERRTFLTAKFPIVRDSGAIQIGGISVDISDRKAAEAKLGEERNLLRTLIDTIPDAIYVKDRDHRLILGNPALERFFGKEIDQLLGKTDFDLGIARSQLYWDEEELIFQAGRSTQHEVAVRQRDGSPYINVIYKAPIRNARGEVIGLVGVNRDITAQKLAELDFRAALEREQQQRVQAQTLRRTAETLVQSTDLAETLAHAADHLRELIAFDQLLIQTVERDRLVALVSIGLDEQMLGPGSEQGYVGIAPLHATLTAGGQITLAEIAATPARAQLLDAGAQLDDWLGMALVSRQITLGMLRIGRVRGCFSAEDTDVIKAFGYQIALAIDNARVVHELADSYTQLQQTQERLLHAARLSAIGELAAGVAHQINNPLMTVVADSHLLLQDLPPDTPAYESAQAIHRAAYRAGAIVERLLNFARTRPSAMRTVEVNDSVRQAVNLVRPQLELGRVEIWTELAGDLPDVTASEEHLLDIWMNLLINARDAVRDRAVGRIVVKTHYDPIDNAVVVAVQDNGTGIAPAALAQIFSPFFTTKERGTGLGLAICADIVEHHHGSIDVASEPDQGATFTVRLPAIHLTQTIP